MQTIGKPTKKRMLRTVTAMTGLTGMAATGVAMTGAGTALANTANGEQVQSYNPSSSHIQICGHNQNGTHVCTPWFAVPESASIFVHHYWWKGQVWIYGYNNSASNPHCVVPKTYTSSFYYCGTL